jgi:hypothetical protein
MPFTSPALYFRTIDSTVAETSDPVNLPVAQILQFDSTNNIIELVDNTYQNNVSIDPATNPNGSKKTFLQDNGRLEDIVIVTGKILNTNTTFINKLKTFSRKLQIEPAFHKVGIFGFAYPVTDSFNQDPTNDVGYFIDKLQLITKGQSKAVVEFVLTLKTGGTLV